MNNLTRLHYTRFDNAIWKIHKILDKNQLCVETRNKNTQEITLNFIGTDRKIILESIFFPWHTNIEAVYENLIICSIYDDVQLPKPSRYLFFDIENKKILLELSKINRICFFRNGIEYYDQLNICYCIDNKCNTFNKSQLAELEIDFEQTFFTTQQGLYFEEFKTMIEELNLPTPFQNIQYLEIKDSLVFSYDFLDAKDIKYKIVIVESDKSLSLNFDILKNNQGLVDNTYFIFQNSVLFLGDEQTLCTYKLY